MELNRRISTSNLSVSRAIWTLDSIFMRTSRLLGRRLEGVEEAVLLFIERLRRLSEDLPRRTVPLRIEPFGPTTARMVGRNLQTPLAVQEAAIAAWTSVLPDHNKSQLVC